LVPTPTPAGQPEDFVHDIGREPGPPIPKAGKSGVGVSGAGTDNAQQVLDAPGFAKRAMDPGHGPTPAKVKKGFKKYPRARAKPTFPMKSFGGQI